MHRHRLCKYQKYIPNSEFETHYNLLLQSCNSLATLKQIHSSLTIAGSINQYPHLGAQFITNYSKFGYPQIARSLFEEIRHGPNSFLWNTMLRAYTNGGHFSQTMELYSLMRKTSIAPNNYTYPFALKACASELLSYQGKLVHCDVIRTGFDSDMYVEAALVDMYAKCGLIDDSCKVFDKMSKRDLVCWTAMITAYEQAERAEEAIGLFHKMQLEGLFMDSVTSVSIASAVGQLGDAKMAMSVHAYAVCNGLFMDVCVGNSIIAMYGKCGKAEKARFVFDRMWERDSITWNSMLSCYTQNGLASDALSLFDQMQASDVKCNPVTALIMVSACAYMGSQQIARKIHHFIVDNETRIEPTLFNAIVNMYAKCGDLGTAVEMFDKNPLIERNVSSWNALISGYGMHGFGREAVELFSRMQEEGVEPNHITFTSLLSACSHAGLIGEGRMLFTDMEKLFSVKPEPKHYACMVDMLGRAGFLIEAYDLIKTMLLKPNDEVWGALLLACRIHQNTELGEIAADNLLWLEPQHTGYYVLMSNIYAASSKWQEVVNLRQDMKNRRLIKPAAYSATSWSAQ
ncbi:hypothetical protein LguiB_017258 [Lonicera macranthoides]